MTRCRKLSAHYVLTTEGLLREGILSFDENGMLTAISSGGRLDIQAAVEFYSGLMAPGSGDDIIEKIGSQSIGLDELAGILGGFEVGKYPGAVLMTGIDWENRLLLRHFSCKQILSPTSKGHGKL